MKVDTFQSSSLIKRIRWLNVFAVLLVLALLLCLGFLAVKHLPKNGSGSAEPDESAQEGVVRPLVSSTSDQALIDLEEMVTAMREETLKAQESDQFNQQLEAELREKDRQQRKKIKKIRASRASNRSKQRKRSKRSSNKPKRQPAVKQNPSPSQRQPAPAPTYTPPAAGPTQPSKKQVREKEFNPGY